MTSSLVAGVLDTYCTQSWLSSVHSLSDQSLITDLHGSCQDTEAFATDLGGSMEFNMSSVCGTSVLCSPDNTAPDCTEKTRTRVQKQNIQRHANLSKTNSTFDSLSLSFFSLALLTSTALSYLTKDCKGGIMSTCLLRWKPSARAVSC